MPSILRTLVAAAFTLAGATAAYAAASNTPTLYQPDPALKTASIPELQEKVRQICAIGQARIQQVSEFSLAKKCDCYAGRTLRAMSAEEVQAYRDTGVFNDSAREKALKAIDSCKLVRPQI
ncbi:hypothetical protein [Microvirga roseola]|uniref:hypothetical protein n=1 Tax=Microvirga roseola TaxID=2883126 RepID=UPI001E4093DA|nr:hypothetical protein [Microvirga roseola]